MKLSDAHKTFLFSYFSAGNNSLKKINFEEVGLCCLKSVDSTINSVPDSFIQKIKIFVNNNKKILSKSLTPQAAPNLVSIPNSTIVTARAHPVPETTSTTETVPIFRMKKLRKVTDQNFALFVVGSKSKKAAEYRRTFFPEQSFDSNISASRSDQMRFKNERASFIVRKIVEGGDESNLKRACESWKQDRMTEIVPGYNRRNIVASIEELAKLAMAVNMDFIMVYRNHNDKVKNHSGGSGLQAARRIAQNGAWSDYLPSTKSRKRSQHPENGSGNIASLRKSIHLLLLAKFKLVNGYLTGNKIPQSAYSAAQNWPDSVRKVSPYLLNTEHLQLLGNQMPNIYFQKVNK